MPSARKAIVATLGVLVLTGGIILFQRGTGIVLLPFLVTQSERAYWAKACWNFTLGSTQPLYELSTARAQSLAGTPDSDYVIIKPPPKRRPQAVGDIPVIGRVPYVILGETVVPVGAAIYEPYILRRLISFSNNPDATPPTRPLVFLGGRTTTEGKHILIAINGDKVEVRPDGEVRGLSIRRWPYNEVFSAWGAEFTDAPPTHTVVGPGQRDPAIPSRINVQIQSLKTGALEWADLDVDSGARERWSYRPN